MASSTTRPSATGSLKIVIKVGTSSLVCEDTNSPNLTNLAKLCESVRRLRDLGHQVCIVSSGAVGLGCLMMKLAVKPSTIPEKQALAAIGQGALMRLFSDFFASLSINCAQVLVTAEALASNTQYALAQQTFSALFEYDTVPIVNENDTVNIRELRIGDNDTLSAQVAAMVAADWLVLLTDVDYLYTANPSTHPSATPIEDVRDVASLQVDTSGCGTQWGTGGMATKLTAARIACAAGCTMAICRSDRPEAVEVMVAGGRAGTVFHPLGTKMRDRKKWILSVPVKGSLSVDDGCATALEQKKNLYAAGVLSADGDFGIMDCVDINVASRGVTIARGLVNFSRQDMDRIKGLSSSQYPTDLVGGSDQVMFRNNISLLVPSSQTTS